MIRRSLTRRTDGDEIPFFGRLILFLLISCVSAGLLSQLIDDPLLTMMSGLALGAAGVSKLEGRIDLLSGGLALFGGGLLLWNHLFPTAAECERQRAKWLWLGEQQVKAADYWQVCAAARSEDAGWCADNRPEESLEKLQSQRDKLFRHMYARCWPRHWSSAAQQEQAETET